MTEQAWGAGYVIEGKYRLVSMLGEGGMGSVWRADHLTLNSQVAVKLLDPSIANTPEGRERFIREAQAAAALRGTNVVQTFDYGVSENVPYIVMEMMVGESLADRLTAQGRLSPRVVAEILKQVARPLSKAHQMGIVHRDLKPDNIFLVTGDDEFTAKVLDFGIAKSTNPLAGGGTDSKTRTGALLGTPYYMSPEQAQGIRGVDHRTDLWALAVIVFECLTGRRPFDSEALGDLLLRICAAPIPVPSQYGAVPAGFDAWFARAASREPEGRFSTATEMARTFEAICAGEASEPAGAAPSREINVNSATVLGASVNADSLVGTVGAVPRPRSRALTVAAIAATLVVATAIAFLMLRGKANPGESPVSASAALEPTPTPVTSPALSATAPSQPADTAIAPRAPVASPVVAVPEPAASASPPPPAATHARPGHAAPVREETQKSAPAPAPAPAAAHPPAPEDDDPLFKRQ